MVPRISWRLDEDVAGGVLCGRRQPPYQPAHLGDAQGEVRPRPSLDVASELSSRFGHLPAVFALDWTEQAPEIGHVKLEATLANLLHSRAPSAAGMRRKYASLTIIITPLVRNFLDITEAIRYASFLG